jgi:uncharacterized protein
MRQSLFEVLKPPAPPPRMQPNIYARLARFSFQNCVAVLIFWAVATALAVTGIILNSKKFDATDLSFSGGNIAMRNLALLENEFPNLNQLMTIHLHNEDPPKLKIDRVELIADLESDASPFELVFAPGAGEYYDRYAMYYYAADSISARVAYAKSLSPLFSAIAEAPTTESLATLVTEVSASINQGRNPGGMAIFFDEAALAVQALMQGGSRNVDWTKIAGLDAQPESTDALILAIPKPEKFETATHVAEAAIAKMRAQQSSIITLQIPVATKAAVPTLKLKPNFAASAMALIFFAFVIFATLGRGSLAALLVAPIVPPVATATGLLCFVFGQSVQQLWPFLLGLALYVMAMNSFLGIEVLKTLSKARNRQSAVMLAFQNSGGKFLLLAFMSAAIWLSFAVTRLPPFEIMSAVIACTIVVAALTSLTLMPALSRALPGTIIWGASDWLIPIYQSIFANPIWRIVSGLVSLALIGTAITAIISAYPPELTPRSDETTVQVLVRSEADAEAALKILKSVPEAKSAQWLGAFLPQEKELKQAALQDLKNQFPRFKPQTPQDPASLREHINILMDGLQTIAANKKVTAPLKTATQNFRRSLAVLADTGKDGEVLEFENRIYGAFNRLSDRADELASLQAPTMQNLAPELKSLFLSSNNIYRLEVSPVSGVTNSQLGEILSAKGLSIASATLAASGTKAQSLRNSLRVILAASAIGFMLVLISIRSFAGTIAATLIGGIILLLVLAALSFARIPPNAESTAFAVSLIGFASLVLTVLWWQKTETTDTPTLTLAATQTWLPVAALMAVALPIIVLEYSTQTYLISIFVAACSTVLLLASTIIRFLQAVGPSTEYQTALHPR